MKFTVFPLTFVKLILYIKTLKILLETFKLILTKLICVQYLNRPMDFKFNKVMIRESGPKVDFTFSRSLSYKW